MNDPMALDGDFIQPAPTTEAEKMPELPEDSFFGGFEELHKAYWRTNETCKPYLLAQGLATVSAVIGRQAALSISKEVKTERSRAYRVYPNTYHALIGGTSNARKSTCRSNMLKDIRDIDVGHDIVFETGVASAESLIHSLRNDGKDESPSWIDGDFPEGIRYMLHLDELRILMANARRSGTQTIIPKLTELYSCPEYDESKAISKGRVIAHYPVVNIFACSTQEWLESSVYADDISGGFINRFMFWNYEDTEGVPFPEAPHPEHLENWLNTIKYARAQVRLREFILSKDAAEEYEKMYHQHREDQKNEEDIVLMNVNARKMDHVFKLALLFSLVTNNGDDDKISSNAWGAACSVAEYLTVSTYHIFQDVGMDETSRNESIVLEALNALGNKATSRSIQRKIGNRNTNAKTVNSMLEELVKIGELVMETQGRTTVYVRI